MTSTIGYARVSTRVQNVDSQVADLEEAGCTKVFVVELIARWRRCVAAM